MPRALDDYDRTAPDVGRTLHRFAAKWGGTCKACGRRYKVGTAIYWDPATKDTFHLGDQCAFRKSSKRSKRSK